MCIFLLILHAWSSNQRHLCRGWTVHHCPSRMRLTACIYIIYIYIHSYTYIYIYILYLRIYFFIVYQYIWRVFRNHISWVRSLSHSHLAKVKPSTQHVLGGIDDWNFPCEMNCTVSKLWKQSKIGWNKLCSTIRFAGVSAIDPYI